MVGIETDIMLAGALAALFAGVSKGGFGSSAAFAGAAILALVMPPGQALGVMLPLLMLIDAATLRPYWRKWSGPDVRLLLLGGVPGTALGAALFTLADADVFRLLIGGISIGFVLWQACARAGLWRPETWHLSPRAGLLAGIVAGFTSFVSHAGGPVAAIYLLSRPIGKTAYQATTVLLFWLLNILKFIPYAWLGMFTLETLKIDLILAPFALIGAWLGVRAHLIVSERLFFAITYVALTVTGIKLMWDGLT